MPTLPHHTLSQHSALLQKALTAALGIMEVLRLTNKDLEEEHNRMQNRVIERENNLITVTEQLLQAQEKPPTKAKRATKGAASKQQSQAEQDVEMWRKSYQVLSEKTKGNQTIQDLDRCNNKVQELQDQLQQQQQINAELQEKLKHLQGEKTLEKGPNADKTTQTEEVVPQANTTPHPQEADQHNTEDATFNLSREVTELRKKLRHNSLTIDFLHERNKELWNKTQSTLPLQTDTTISLSSEEWYTVNGSLNQAIKYFRDLFKEVESAKLNLPHAAKDYRIVLKEFEEARKQLEELSDARPPTPKCPQIGDSDFQLDPQTSQLFKHFKEILQDPERPGLVEVSNVRSKTARPGLGASAIAEPFSGRRAVSYTSLLSPTSTQQRQPQEKPTTSEDPKWEKYRNMPPIEGLDDYQDIEALMVDSVQPPPTANPLFRPEFPVQSLLTDSQIQERISHLRELFGDENVDHSERILSQGKEKYGTQWQLHDDPFLLHHRMAKVCPIPYTEWPHKQGFQIYPYIPYQRGLSARPISKARQEGFTWAWVRFKKEGFVAQNLTDFIEIRMVTTELQYLARWWVRQHRNEDIYKPMPKFKTQAWEDMLLHQPSWRRSYLRKEDLYTIFVSAPSHIRADPLYYPTPRRWKWPTWESYCKRDSRISYNFPLLPDQEYTSMGDF